DDRGDQRTRAQNGTLLISFFQGRARWRLLAGVFMLIGLALVARATYFWPGTSHVNSTPRLYKPISEVRVGERIFVNAPGHQRDGDSEEDEQIEPANWRKISLHFSKLDGTSAEIVLLRPMEWLEKRSARPGGFLTVGFPDCGISGQAEVLSIEPCPAIKE